ncbi:DUF1573 domain-containing protein [Prevotella sp. 10(H)]|uniref:DUF1573 domain-containing protein n=1 Tax=Prevotella sp. 10(H) TaxID=1158294 RepID=UPI0004A70E8E|nr:DUF1573 domain-containing protein [Prevotella sp. 10(H)]
MKKAVIILFAFLFSIGLSHAQEKQTAKKGKPEITLCEVAHNFGKIEKSKKLVTHDFILKNTGDAPLIVQRVITGCGCAKADYPNAPILPGKEGKITIKYETTTTGVFNKTMTVFSNAEAVKTLNVKGEIIDK